VRGTGRQARSSIRLKLRRKGRDGSFLFDRASLARGFGVNFIHSLDAYIARSIIRTFKEYDFAVATIHDCFIIHPSQANLLYNCYNTALRQAITHGRAELLRLLAKAEKKANPTSALTIAARPIIDEFKALPPTPTGLDDLGPYLFF